MSVATLLGADVVVAVNEARRDAAVETVRICARWPLAESSALSVAGAAAGEAADDSTNGEPLGQPASVLPPSDLPEGAGWPSGSSPSADDMLSAAARADDGAAPAHAPGEPLDYEHGWTT